MRLYALKALSFLFDLTSFVINLTKENTLGVLKNISHHFMLLERMTQRNIALLRSYSSEQYHQKHITPWPLQPTDLYVSLSRRVSLYFSVPGDKRTRFFQTHRYNSLTFISYFICLSPKDACDTAWKYLPCTEELGKTILPFFLFSA